MFVLVEFSDKSLSVMDESAIDDYDKCNPTAGSEVVVTWPATGKKKAEKCHAIILKVGGNKVWYHEAYEAGNNYLVAYCKVIVFYSSTVEYVLPMKSMLALM